MKPIGLMYDRLDGSTARIYRKLDLYGSVV
jgi:hypothetical protein